jgi:hypothetical protein
LIRATCTATPFASRLHLCARFSLDSQRSYSLRTAPSEATYSHCTPPRNTCAPSPITPTASQSRHHTVRRAGSANGAAVVFLIATPTRRPTLLLRSLFGGNLMFRTPFVMHRLLQRVLYYLTRCSVGAYPAPSWENFALHRRRVVFLCAYGGQHSVLMRDDSIDHLHPSLTPVRR